MTVLWLLTKRNVKLFFKDKGMFFTALITPLILLVLYATFLGNVYRDGFLAGLPTGVTIADELIDSCVAGQLISSILAVSCVTVSFCANMLSVQDKANGSGRDLTVSPVKASTFALGYYLATLLSTLLICVTAMGMCLLYVAWVGWYMSVADVLCLLLDTILLVLFGTALSSVINFFLSTQGQISAVGSIVSSMYGFICGAYMPLSQLGEGLQKVVLFLPGTYGTSLMRNHAMHGVFAEMKAQGVPAEALTGMQDVVDYNLYFFGEKVPIGTMYLVLTLTVTVLVLVYILLQKIAKKAK